VLFMTQPANESSPEPKNEYEPNRKKLRSNRSSWGFFIGLSKIKLNQKDCHPPPLKRQRIAELIGKPDFHALAVGL